jgi:glycine/D-amino acid oxidase-like deaminating enzyme
MGRDYRSLSLWFDQLAEPLTPRAALSGDTEVDVAIVGAGFTGLWTAYYLHAADPTLRIAVLEKEIAGFGASGRNGGWCSALFPISAATLAAEAGRDAAIAQYAAVR